MARLEFENGKYNVTEYQVIPVEGAMKATIQF